MRILLISYYFPPFNNIGAVRAGKLAEYWLRAGHDVRVISARDQPLAPSLPMQFPLEKVRYAAWLNVNTLPEMAMGGRGKVVSQGYSRQGSFLGKGGKIYKTLFNFPDGQIGWFPFAVREGKKLIREGWRPDLIYASAKPFTSLLIAKKLAAKYRIPWVAEFRDLWSDNHYYEFPEWRRWIEERLEKRVLSSASAVVTVSEPLAETLRRKLALPVATILNGFDPKDYRQTAEKLFLDNQLNIVYTGMIYAGKQDPSALFMALKGLRSRDRIRVHFFGRYLQEIERLAEQHGVRHLISVSGAVPYEKAIQIQMQGDILLLLLWNDKNERGVYTGKLFEYFGARHPILAIGSESGVAGELIEERKAGIVSNDPMMIARQMEEWLSLKEMAPENLLLTASAGEGLSREDQFAKLDSFLQEHHLLTRQQT